MRLAPPAKSHDPTTQPERTAWSSFRKLNTAKELGKPLGHKVFLTEDKLQSDADQRWFPGNTAILSLQDKAPGGGLACSLPTDRSELRLCY